MYIVSDEYKEQIRQPLRNSSSVKVLLDIENADADDDSTITESAPASPISNASVLNDDYFVNDRIGTMEINRFILDGESNFGKYADQEIYQGYISQIPSSSSNVWASNPYITIDFSYEQILDGLSFVFDNLLYGYPTDMRIEVFNGVTSVLDTHVYPDSYEWTYNSPIPACTKIILTAQATSLRYWRFRIEDIIFGIVKQLDSSVITTCNWKQEVDLVDAKLPTYDFDFSFLDIAGEFNPDDDTSLYQYLGRRQRVRFYFGYELNDATIEWVKGSEYFTTGEVSVDAQSNIPIVSIKSSSRLYFLTEEYTEGKYLNVSWSLGGLLEDLTTFMGINPLYNDILHQYSYVISDYTYFNVQTKLPLPKLPINQCLQLLANASMCVLEIDRDGKIVMFPRKLGAEDFALTFTDMYKAPLIKKYPQLQGVDTAINLISKESSLSTILTTDVTGAVARFYEFSYDGYTDVIVTLTGLSYVGTPEIYDGLMRCYVTGTGSIKIEGKQLITTEQLVSYEYQLRGERCPSKNELIYTLEHALDYAEWISEYASCTNQYEIENRGFPELDMDNITFDTVLNTNLYGTVFYNEVTYDGTLKGKTKILMAKNLFTTIVNVSGTFASGQELILPIGYSK